MATREQKIDPNFLNRFNGVLQEVDLLPPDQAQDEAALLQDPNIRWIAKKAPAMLFSWRDTNEQAQFDIWPDLLTNVHPDYQDRPHLHLQLDLVLHVRDPKMFWSAYVLQDSKGPIYLTVESTEQNRDIYRYLQDDDTGDEYTRAWRSMLRRYGIERTFGAELEKGREELDFVGRTRINNAYLDFARRYNLTSLQFMRFRVMADAAFEVDVPVNWDNLVKEVLVFDDKY